MKISRGNKILIATTGAVIAMVIGLAVFVLSDEEQNMTALPTNIIQSAHTPEPSDITGAASMAPQSPEERGDMLEDRLVKELQRKYGKMISDVVTQAGLLDVKKHIISLFPGDEGPARFRRIIERAFPEYADAIIATLDKLEAFQRWLADNEGSLARMSNLERRAALWEKRHALFGEDADKIWTGELLASEARTAAMQDTMTVLAESRDTTVEEKLDVFQDELRKTYEDSPDAYILDQQFMLAKIFLSIESVQDELKEMPPEQRQFKINQIRRDMGFSEQEIENLETLDAERNRRWENGLSYMEERDAVASQLTGAELEEKLKDLRVKYFKDEANTIEREENEDFFRFKRPRIYGRNS